MVNAVQLAAIAKKVLQFLLTNKKGRKFLGYVIGIALFVILLPFIVLIGLFGWMSGSDSLVLQGSVIGNLQEQYVIQFPEHAEALDKISTTFDIYGIGDKTPLAQTIYISTDLPSINEGDDFYTEYVRCFIDTEEKSYIENITEVFGIEFTEKDIGYLTAINSS